MKRVICVVEDEKDLNNLVAQYLRKEGYEVRSYYTYEEASAHVQEDILSVRFILMMKLCCIKMMMFIYGSWISCWMTNQVLI